MKHLKKFESYVDRKKHWYCTTDGIKVISGVLDMMDIDYELRYDADDDLDGILDYHDLVWWYFNINGYGYKIVIDANETDDDYDKYDGSSISTLFYTDDQDDPNYNMDGQYIENGEDLLKILIDIKGNPWINKINESINNKFKWTKTTEAIDIISKIFNSLNITHKWFHSTDGDMDGMHSSEARTSVNFEIDNHKYYITIECAWREPKWDEENNYDGSDISVYLYAREETNPHFQEDPMLIDDGEDLFHYISKINGSSFKWMKKINESKDNKFEWTCTTEAIDVVSKILDKINIKYKEYNSEEDKNNLDGILKTDRPANFKFNVNEMSYIIMIHAKRLRFGYDGSDVELRLESWDGVESKMTTIKDGKDLYHHLSSITGDSANWMKKINGTNENMKHIQSFKIYEKKNTFVNTNTFDLEKWYEKLNKQFFGGKLKKVPLKWNQAKKELGVVKWDEKSGKIEHLALSDKFKLTEAELLSVLAHEMIHVWQVQNKKTDGHGTNFKKEMARINDKTKWGIKVMSKQPMGHLKMTNPDLDKDYGFVVIKNTKDDFDIAIFNPDKTDYKNILTIIKQNIKGSKKVDVEVRSTQNGTVKQYKKESTNTTISTFKLDEVTFDTLMSDSKKIYGGKIGK